MVFEKEKSNEGCYPYLFGFGNVLRSSFRSKSGLLEGRANNKTHENEKRNIVDLAKLYCWVIWFDNEYRGIKQPFSYQAIKKQYPPQSLQYQAVLVWETSGEYVPKDFEQKVFADLRKQMVELSEETSR